MFDAIILAGGAARRLDGADKPALEVGGRTLLDHAIEAARGAVRIIVVGPQRPIGVETAAELTWAREDPPGSGPVAALAAGLGAVTEDYVLVLAADLPRIGAAVPLLLSGASKTDVAVLTSAGRRNYLAAVWLADALRSAVKRLGDVRNAAMRDLYTDLRVFDVPDEDDWSADCDTPEDLAAARHREAK